MRKVIALTGLLAGMTLLAGILARRSAQVERRQPFAGVNPAEAAKLELERGGETTVLERSGDAWRVTAPFPDLADSAPVQEIVQGLSKLSLGLEVSREVSSYPDYTIHEASATRVRLTLAGEAAPKIDAYFGKEALGYDSLYVRFPREAPVYIATGLGSWRLNRSASDFRDRRVMGMEKEAVESARLSGPGFNYDLTKTSAGWSQSRLTIPEDRLTGFLEALTGLRASDFAAPEDSRAADFERPALTAELSGGLLRARLVIGGAKAEKSGAPIHRFARVDGRPAVLLIGRSDVEALLAILKPSGKK